jgi:hypothetical protein
MERDQAHDRSPRDCLEPADANEIASALAPSLLALMARDSTALTDLLSRFAAVLRTSEALAAVRFDDADFAGAVERVLSQLGRGRGPGARARLFQHAMGELGDRRTARRLRDQLARARSAATLSPSDREAVSAALVCLEPVLGKRAAPASTSPTLEIIFNAQLETWMERLDMRALELKVAIRDWS